MFSLKFVQSVLKMNPSFIARYNEANEKLGVLRNHFNSLQLLKVKEITEARKRALVEENIVLESRVKQLKKELSDAEILNGKTQVALPSNLSRSCLSTASDQPAGDAKTVNEKPKAKKQPKQEKKSKPAKANEQEVKQPVDVSRLDLRIGRIVSVEKHPDADSLYVEQVNTGEENPRTVVSGLVKHIPLDQMENRMVILMMNLKPAKMRGILSQAMVMCGSSPDKVEIIDPPPGCVPGDRVTFKGYPGEPDKQLNPKRKVWESVQPDLKTDGDCIACYKGVPFTVEGKGVCKVQTMVNSSIK